MFKKRKKSMHRVWWKRKHFTFIIYMLNQSCPLQAFNSSSSDHQTVITGGGNCVSDGSISADSWTVQKQANNTRCPATSVYGAGPPTHQHLRMTLFSLFSYSSPNTLQSVQRWRESFSEINYKSITHNNLPDSSSKETVPKALLWNAQQAPPVELLF